MLELLIRLTNLIEEGGERGEAEMVGKEILTGREREREIRN